MFIFVNKTNQATHPGWAQTVSAQGSAAARPEDAPPRHFPLLLLLQRHRTWWQLHQSCLSSPFPHPRLQSGLQGLGGSSSPKSGTGWGFPKWAFWFSNISFAFSCMNPQSLADVELYRGSIRKDFNSSKAPKNGSVFTSSHFSGHWTSPKALLGKSPMAPAVDPWNRLTSLKTWHRNVNYLLLKMKIIKRIWCQKLTTYKKWMKTSCSEF